MTRTTEEIIERIKSVEDQDFFGDQITDLLLFLEFEDAKPWLKEEAGKAEWLEKELPLARDRESILAKMADYIEFAWSKANGCRGLSAARSMSHYTAWTWMIGDDDTFGDLMDYQFYGKDNLVKLCEHYGWDHTQWDDGVRSNTEY